MSCPAAPEPQKQVEHPTGTGSAVAAEDDDQSATDQQDHDQRCHHSECVDHDAHGEALVPAGCSRTRTPHGWWQPFAPKALRLFDDRARTVRRRVADRGPAVMNPGRLG